MLRFAHSRGIVGNKRANAMARSSGNPFWVVYGPNDRDEFRLQRARDQSGRGYQVMKKNFVGATVQRSVNNLSD